MAQVSSGRSTGMIDPGVQKTAAITGGTIDGTPIGATTASTGRFTTVVATSTINATGTITGPNFVAGDGTGSPFVRLNGVTGSGRYVQWQTAASLRWRCGASSSAEGGADAGSPWVLEAFQDDGVTSLGQVINCQRAAGGAILFTRPLQPASGSAAAPTHSFSTDTNTGLFRVAAGTMSHVASGVEYLRASAAQFTYSKNTSVLLGTAPITNVSPFTIHGVDAVATQLALCAYGASAGLVTRRAEGTAALPTQIVANSVLRNDQVIGYEATTPAFTGNKNVYLVIASEAWTTSAQGYYHRWDANNTGTTSPLEKMRLSQGNLLIGTTTDGMTADGSLAVAKDLAHRGTKIGFMNTAPIVQKTGYGTPTGNAYQASFAAGSITLPNLAAAVAQLIIDLKAYGLIGA